MGTVYKGRHRQSGLLVAIKIIPPATSRNPVLLRRFEQEFRAASMLDHPNIVKAIEYNGLGQSPFLVMEFVDGESLGQKIERDGPMPEMDAIRILAQVCQGLHRAHKQGLIHRDVKPDNILVTADGVAKLTDLGLVKDVEGEMNLTRTGRGLGTPHFMAPEQFRNAKNVDVRSDIYSLGATLYMMVTGEIPFGKCGPLDCWMKKVHNDFAWPRQLNPHVSERVDWAIRRSMSGDPTLRPASCREFVEDLTGQTIRPQNHPEHAQTQDLWYLVYRDDLGEMHTVKGSTDGIRRALSEGLLGDAENIRACRTKQGPFQPLRGIPEFRDLVIDPSVAPPPSTATKAATPASAMTTPPTAGMRTPASNGTPNQSAQWNRSGGRPPIPPTGTAPPADAESVNLDGPLDRSQSASASGARSSASGRLSPPSGLGQPTPSGRMPAPGTSGRLPVSNPAANYQPTTAYEPMQHGQIPGQNQPPVVPLVPQALPENPEDTGGTDWVMLLMVMVLSASVAVVAMMYIQQGR
ncbi:serine threonine protein kinase : Putative serine/threonine protein kinase OS=Gemmata sp. Wa1-1 PE=4 SV=1: Pkinase [Tuwongella immobilis]|uniref:Protein kinase domain-containing protein n=2 Tax=Tuwongella immobilis TaxID=692036 RepID=A0A6C2YU37_9BACT|nr:serine threonine protein kinase : Putative serine/threonine protein kinase OS=Gemmata sp. Wa1-1 PE=4 SV=1: Pkinase [Tuwongella immobilis]VTS07246.1 serine threonine protein kinase : Putative serine/threonine protein kinase OS=Gemmata sp. Wa1-1 PE=4 SV=1: Pkinase [Tuwongella immobilis]